MGWRQILLDATRALAPGREWAEAVHVWYPGVVNVTAAGTGIFYVALYERAEFDRQRAMHPFRFPFLVGSARATHFQRYNVAAGDYVAIIRVSGWAGREVQVHVRVQHE